MSFKSSDSSGLQDTPTTTHRKREVEKIIDMIREYLCMGRGSIGNHGDSSTSEKQKEIDDLDSLASRLTLSENEHQSDDQDSTSIDNILAVIERPVFINLAVTYNITESTI